MTKIVKCNYCETPVPEEAIKAKLKRRPKQTRFYCNIQCCNADRRKYPQKHCEDCEAPISSTARRCKACFENRGGLGYKWSDAQILHLAAINPSYGFREFVAKIFTSKGVNCTTRVFDLFEMYKETTEIDLYAHLQNPDMMVETHWTDFLDKNKHLPGGISAASKRKYKNRETLKPRPSKKNRGKMQMVKHSPEFNWGDVDPKGW